MDGREINRETITEQGERILNEFVGNRLCPLNGIKGLKILSDAGIEIPKQNT